MFISFKIRKKGKIITTEDKRNPENIRSLYFTNKIQVSQIHLFVYNILSNIFIKIEMKFRNFPKIMLNFCPQNHEY